MKKLTIRMDREAAQRLDKNAAEAGIPASVMARSLIIRGIESPTDSVPQNELRDLLLAVLRAASMAAAMSEIAATRGADLDAASRLLDAGAEKAGKKFAGYLEMFNIEIDGGDV